MPQRRLDRLLSSTEPLDHDTARLHAPAEQVPHGLARDRLLRKAGRAETATHVNEWLASPGLRASL